MSGPGVESILVKLFSDFEKLPLFVADLTAQKIITNKKIFDAVTTYKTIKAISSALDAKDPYTHGHSYRVTLYSMILAISSSPSV